MLRPWERRKPPEYYSASDFEKMQWACGIPARFWNTKEASIKPSGFKYDCGRTMESVGAATQKKYYKARLDQPELMRSNRFVCLTSYPSDDYALAAACLLASAAIEASWQEKGVSRVRVDDIQDYEKSIKLNRDFYSAPPEILVLYNFNPNTSRERLSLAHDLLNSFEGAYRMVVASSENPFKFARESLHAEPHEVYHFEGKPRKVLQL